MRIVSMVPSATEIVGALGLVDDLVGVTYECDFPPEVRGKAVVVESTLPQGLAPAEIHRLVSEAYQAGRNYFRVRTDLLAELQPDLIITQGVCSVCAVAPGQVDTALHLHPPVRNLVLRAETVEGIFEDIRQVGTATDRTPQAEALVDHLRTRLKVLRSQVPLESNRPRVLLLEWLDPPIVAGHWVPEMVEWAGGIHVLNEAGRPSRTIPWTDVEVADPDVIFLIPCGYRLSAVLEEIQRLPPPAGWSRLRCVRRRAVWAVDASAYFSRPGPRFVHGVEVLIEVLWGLQVFSDVWNPAAWALAETWL
ncbi:MAG: cobalamin-binding protein [Acidobacteria bacterium]|nr:cobalamin-binding protein [Acidobacteriota bacterium]MDW7985107.1 cobalamin-binding protein [Acidobacteriota bacterium]